MPRPLRALAIFAALVLLSLTFTSPTTADPGSWDLRGNGGTSPGFHFLGTTDDKALVLKVNDQRALLIRPTFGTPNLIGGASINRVGRLVEGATISGGGDDTKVFGDSPNRVTGDFGTVGGGVGNLAGNEDGDASNNRWNTVSGGSHNQATGSRATVGGGGRNRAPGVAATVSGGQTNFASELATSVGGGSRNQAIGVYATVGGGSDNFATGHGSIIAGGGGNHANGPQATVGGGRGNLATGSHATVAGGRENRATGRSATVAGGLNNIATGRSATVAGGRRNTASGDYGLAAGRRARADAEGAFVWADSNDFDFPATSFPCGGPSCGADTFNVRATGGARFVSAIDSSTGATTAGVVLQPGAGSWSSLSDRHAKANVRPVNPQAVLQALAGLPISTFRYRTQGPEVRHMGPMAQDFFRAFGLGDSPRYIATVDADGVALAAIKGLHAKVRAQGHTVGSLKRDVGLLRSLVRAQGERITALQRQVRRLAAG
jgi:trimeric autotransporter adhesin